MPPREKSTILRSLDATLAVGRGRKKRSIKQARLVVRRTRLTDTAQRRLWPEWRHHALLRLPARWPWARAFNTVLNALRALPAPSG